MTRALALAAALAGLLALPAAAGAATFTVNHAGDAGDAVPNDALCDDGAGNCTLRAAVEEANALAGRDEIGFAAGITQVDVPTTIAVTGQLALSGPGVTLRLTGAGPLLRLEAGAAGAPGTPTTLAGLRLEGTGGSSGGLLAIESSETTASGLAVTGAAGHGIDVAAGAGRVTIASSTITASGGDGVRIAGQDVVVTRSLVYGNAGRPIGLASGANGGIAAPSGLRIGPRRADGTLPLTGSTASGGTLEVFRGDANGAAAIAFLTDLGVAAGAFSLVPAPEPAPGTVLSATVTSGGTSQFATARVPDDVVSPALAGGVATSTSQVVLQMSEPVDASSLQPEDFVLEMAGRVRRVTGAALGTTTSEVVLTAADAWGHGEAGFAALAAPGAVIDGAANASLATDRVRVAASPGDLIAPIASSLAIRPRRACLTQGRRCKRPGLRLRFVSSEAGRAVWVVMRGNRRIGSTRTRAVVGRNAVRWSGRLRGRKLRAGSYRLLLYVEDAVGNLTAEPPLQRFEVVRTTGGKAARKSRRRR